MTIPALNQGRDHEEGTTVDDNYNATQNPSDPLPEGHITAVQSATGVKDSNLQPAVGTKNGQSGVNRRIEMPPAFHFPEDQTPPSDLLASPVKNTMSSDSTTLQSSDPPHELTENPSLYPMMNQIYKEFDQLSPEEQKRIQV